MTTLLSSATKGGASWLANFDLGRGMQSLKIGEKFSISGVIIHAGQDASGNKLDYFAGTNLGYVLEIDNPMGTQQMAQALADGFRYRLRQYQPYEANKVELNPAAEIGDDVTVNGKTSTIVNLYQNHSPMMSANVSAPNDEEVQHAFDYQPRSERQFERATSELRSRLTITEGAIEATVSRTGGNEASFGWKLTDSDWSVYSNGSRVLHATADGLEITGKVIATSGFIGGCEIVGGVLTINSANITSINADVINAGTINVARIADSSLAETKFTSGVQTNLGYASGFCVASTSDAWQTGSGGVGYFTCGNLNQTGIYMKINGHACQLLSGLTINGQAYHFLGYVG